jgi:hypothetical protein
MVSSTTAACSQRASAMMSNPEEITRTPCTSHGPRRCSARHVVQESLGFCTVRTRHDHELLKEHVTTVGVRQIAYPCHASLRYSSRHTRTERVLREKFLQGGINTIPRGSLCFCLELGPEFCLQPRNLFVSRRHSATTTRRHCSVTAFGSAVIIIVTIVITF